MKKAVYKITSVTVLTLFLHLWSFGQAANCYSTYKTTGDNLKLKKQYGQAKLQYQNAKNCSYLTIAQRREIDSLITDISRYVPPLPGPIRNVGGRK